MELRGFRNLESTSLVPGERFNVFYGDNAAGKSSLLEAVDYLATLRSFRSAKTEDLIQDSAAHSLIRMHVRGSSLPRSFECRLHRTSPRELLLDGKRPRSIAVWHSSVQAVTFQPGDLEIAAGGPDARRAWMDRVLMQMDPTYASAIATYTRALRSRNRLLKAESSDRRAIASFNEMLASSGVVISLARTRLLLDVAPLATSAFQEITGDDVRLFVTYKPRVSSDVQEARLALEESLEKDLLRGFTAEGPHADDVTLQLAESNARHHASQGQHRALVLSLKVAELLVLARRTGHTPILLLDDVSSELDRGRNRRFFTMLSRMGGQVFLSTTHREFILLDEGRTEFRVETGRIQREA